MGILTHYLVGFFVRVLHAKFQSSLLSALIVSLLQAFNHVTVELVVISSEHLNWCFEIFFSCLPVNRSLSVKVTHISKIEPILLLIT